MDLKEDFDFFFMQTDESLGNDVGNGTLWDESEPFFKECVFPAVEEGSFATEWIDKVAPGMELCTYFVVPVSNTGVGCEVLVKEPFRISLRNTCCSGESNISHSVVTGVDHSFSELTLIVTNLGFRDLEYVGSVFSVNVSTLSKDADKSFFRRKISDNSCFSLAKICIDEDLSFVGDEESFDNSWWYILQVRSSTSESS